jgi:hypothetical protein
LVKPIPRPALYRVKGWIFRAHIAYLKRHGKLDAVVARLSQAAAGAVVSLPLAGSWIEGPLLDEIVEGVDALEGSPGVLAMEEAMLRIEMVQVLLPMVQGVMRIFGASPASLFKRFGDLVRTSSHGIEFQYVETSERSGTMEVRYHTDKTMTRPSFMTTVPALHAILRFCGTSGTVSDPEIRAPQFAQYHISW